MLVLEGAAAQGGQQFVEVGQQDVGGLGELDGEAGVEHVAARHAEMDEAAVRPDLLGEPGQEGDHVMARLALYFVDAFHVCRAHGGERRFAAFAYDAGRLGGDFAKLGHGVRGQGLDAEPDAVAVLWRPDGDHGGAGVTGNHAGGIGDERK